MDWQTIVKDRLGYSDLWIELGALDEAGARAQIAALNEPGADQNCEHYRYGTFRRFICAAGKMSDDQVRLCVAMGLRDPDRAMGGAMLGNLLDHTRLTDKQFEQVAASLDAPWFGKRVARARLIRALRAGATAGQITQAVHHGDEVVQRYVLECCELSANDFAHLAAHGRNRAIRNMAQGAAKRAR